jgi:hypothetical protein
VTVRRDAEKGSTCQTPMAHGHEGHKERITWDVKRNKQESTEFHKTTQHTPRSESTLKLLPTNTAQIGILSLPAISAPSPASRYTQEIPVRDSDPFPRKIAQHEHAVPTDEDAAIMKKLRERGAVLRR